MKSHIKAACKWRSALPIQVGIFTNSVCIEPFLGTRPCVNLRRNWKVLKEPRADGEGMGPGKINVDRVPQGALRKGWFLFLGGPGRSGMAYEGGGAGLSPHCEVMLPDGAGGGGEKDITAQRAEAEAERLREPGRELPEESRVPRSPG